VMFAVAVLGASASLAQAPAAKSATVKAVQPGLFEVAAPRVNEVVAEGITKITATPARDGARSPSNRSGERATSAGPRA
jgi:hypothetical protein